MSNVLETKRRKTHDYPAIVIVAGHTLARTCIVKFLKYELTGWDFIDVASTDELADAHGRAVALVALDMAGRGVDCPTLCADLSAVKNHFPDASIALLSSTDDVLMESQAFEMGVRGFFTSSLPVEVALAGIRLVLAGGIFCPHPLGAQGNTQFSTPINGASAAAKLGVEKLPDINSSTRYEALASFTRREADVLAELQCGHSNKIIAEKLNLSGNTVKMHLQHIMRKLHVQNRTEVVLLVAAKTTALRDTVAPQSLGS